MWKYQPPICTNRLIFGKRVYFHHVLTIPTISQIWISWRDFSLLYKTWASLNMASVLAESWIQIWAQYRAYTSLSVYLKRKLFVMCSVELNWRFYERSKLTFVLPGKWFSDRSAKIPRDFELIVCIENYSKQVWRRVKMRSVGENDIVWIVDTSCKLQLSYILEFFTSVRCHK